MKKKKSTTLVAPYVPWLGPRKCLLCQDLVPENDEGWRTCPSCYGSLYADKEGPFYRIQDGTIVDRHLVSRLILSILNRIVD